MFVNPTGVQGDILTSAATGENSVGPTGSGRAPARMTPDGYNVELRVPLDEHSLQERRPTCAMGVLFWRRVSRLGISVSWPDLPPGKPPSSATRRWSCTT